MRSEQGYRCCKTDLEYGEAMNFDTSGGFLLLSLMYIYVCIREFAIVTLEMY